MAIEIYCHNYSVLQKPKFLVAAEHEDGAVAESQRDHSTEAWRARGKRLATRDEDEEEREIGRTAKSWTLYWIARLVAIALPGTKLAPASLLPGKAMARN
jgi:hypothetical protein